MITQISAERNESGDFISTCVLYLSDKFGIVLLDQLRRLSTNFYLGPKFTKPRKTHLMKFPDLDNDR